ncbi:MAG: HAMP domain-containing histidine kinase [Oscillospiraceae bacterium]|nr:HAMP domain-containing histidine kinase [Oscillospiraceae bacterium]
MKRFFRTGVGKTIAFIMHIVLSVGLAGSVICGILFMHYGIYTQQHEDVKRVLFYDYADDTAESILFGVEDGAARDVGFYSPDGNVVGYEVTEPDGTKKGDMDFSPADADKYSYRFFYHRDDPGVYEWWPLPGSGELGDYEKENAYTVDLYISKYLEADDHFKMMDGFIDFGYSARYGIIALAFVSLIGAVIFFVTLMSSSARVPDSEELRPGPLNRIPVDVMAAAAVCAVVMITIAAGEIGPVRGIVMYILMAVCGVFALCLFDGLCMSIAARIKQRNLITGTLTYKVLKWVFSVLRGCLRLFARIFRSIPLIWKTALFIFLHMVFLILAYQSYTPALFIIGEVIISCAFMYFAYIMRKLQLGARRIAAGDLQYKIDTKEMILDFKEHGENLNRIGVGMDNAVREQMRSERLKTELITNVSHDIKTPLTSIINYVDLINKEECGNEKINEYIEVLDRQSKRLKKLIEDLIEVSKASTGNLDVDLEPSDLGVTLVQAASEYEDKFRSAGLELIMKKPEGSTMVMADGRRMWRVFDNLLNNICKYGLAGTRVYIDLYRENGNAVVSFRNVSRDPLSLSPDEIAERFTRGDSSRNTEGSGLGLSICKSLVDLQGGSQNIYIDGDLFKVVLAFPLITEASEA